LNLGTKFAALAAAPTDRRLTWAQRRKEEEEEEKEEK
jgi:hypothetical protein